MAIRITHTFDVALVARSRCRQLKLRQGEVAQAAQVGREWLVDFEHGKPTVEFTKVLRTLTTLGIEMELYPVPPPAWSLPLIEAATLRRQRLDAIHPKSRPRKERKDLTGLLPFPIGSPGSRPITPSGRPLPGAPPNFGTTKLGANATFSLTAAFALGPRGDRADAKVKMAGPHTF